MPRHESGAGPGPGRGWLHRSIRQASAVIASPSLQASVWIGVGGLSLTGAGLLLAAVLPAEDYGRFAIVVALLSLGAGIAPMGFDQLAVRGEIPRSRSVLIGVAVVSLPASVALGASAVLQYGLDSTVAITVIVGSSAAAIARVVAAYDQGALRLNRAQLLIQLPYLFLALGSVAFWGSGADDWQAAILILVTGFLSIGIVGFAAARREADASELPSLAAFRSRSLWSRAFAFAGIQGGGSLLGQLERILIPILVSLDGLAAYSVVASVIGSPYKLLQAGIGWSLVPRIRQSKTSKERIRLVRNELRFGTGLGLLSAGILLPISGPIVFWLYGDKYPVSFSLLIAVVVLGCIRTLYGVASGTIGGLGDERALALYNRLGWLAIMLGALLSYFLSFAGVVGVVWGVSAAWGLRTGAAFILVRQRDLMRQPLHHDEDVV